MGIGVFDKFINQIPAGYRENPDFIAFAEFQDAWEEANLEAIKRMKDFYDPDKAPSAYLDFIGYPVGAMIARGDSVSTKRAKIQEAVAWNRVKGTEDMAKYWVARITGVDPIFNVAGNQGKYFIWESQENLMPFPNDFARWENKTDGETGKGMTWSSYNAVGGSERFVVYVDLITSTLTTALLDRVEAVIKYFGAAYFRYYVGYRNPGWNLYRQVN